jgi:hypothetical protein
MNADTLWAARHDDATTTIASFITMIAGVKESRMNTHNEPANFYHRIISSLLRKR